MTAYTGQAGVGLLLTPTCPVRDLQDVTRNYASSPDVLSRYLVVRGTVDSVETYIHVVYAPATPGLRAQFFNNLPRNFDDDSDHIVLGDFNTVLSGQLDQARSDDRDRTQGREELLEWMNTLHLVDAWRLHNDTLQEFTSPNTSSRIDYVMLNSRLFNTVFQDIRHDHKNQSGTGDHKGISFRLGASSLKPPGRAPWKCPEWVINLPEARDYLQASLVELADSLRAPSWENYNPGYLLDEHLRKDSIFLRELFQEKKNERQRVIENLHVKVNEIQHLQAQDRTVDYSDALTTARAELKEKLEEQAHFASQQKFASDMKDSERCSRSFFRPPQVLHKTPIPVDSVEELECSCTGFNSYWSGIYCSPSKEFEHPEPKWNRFKLNQLLSHTKPRLTPAQRTYLDSPFTANEFSWALTTTAAGKTPGPDGLPLAYYKVDLPLWSRVMEVIYAAQFQRGKMTKFQRRAQISLLYKKDNRKIPSNYRPITLLNVDAKLGPKILAYRLGSILGTLLGCDQYGFVPGRDIRHAHLRFQALAKLCSDKDSPAGAVLLDFAKAFDSVLWEALDMVLMHFGFGPNFRRWIKVLFPGTLVSLMFNGRPLAPFELGAGVRQGDPLSPGLFVLFIEPLLNLLRAKFGNYGVRCGSSTHTAISFADDCTGLLADLRHTKTFLAIVEEFCAATGMRLNKEKTVILPFKPWTAATEPLRLALTQLGVVVVDNSGSAKLLGIYYGPQLTDADRLQHLLGEMETRCALWLHRARTLRGQVVILKQIILPVLWYSASVCRVPKTGFQAQVNSLMARFLNRFKSRSSLPREWWTLPPSQGGLGLSSIEDTVCSLQLHMLCKVILAGRTPPGQALPSWAEPVIQLFDQAVSPWGKDFDILYAPVTTSPDHLLERRLRRWAGLGAYWNFVLFSWHTRLRPKLTRFPNKFDKLTTPLLNNVDVAYSYRGQTLIGSPRPLGLIPILLDKGLLRPVEFFQVSPGPINAESLSRLLRQFSPGRITSPRSCANFLDKAGSLFRPLAEMPIGPLQSTRCYSAFHSWVFNTFDISELSVARIRKAIAVHKVPVFPPPYLGVEGPPPESMWSRDIKMGKHLLPVYADLLYRLQHNALFLGYRFQHMDDAQSLCHHGCAVLETASHLFWFCAFATQVWEEWLRALQGFFVNQLEWESLLFFKLKPTERAKSQFGYSLFQVVHITRAVIFRCLWMHRNDLRFHSYQPNLIDVQVRVKAVIQLHVNWYYQDLKQKSLSHSGLNLRQLRQLMRSLPLLPFEADTEDSARQ